MPRDEVLRGELREQQFAASLTKVLRGDADEVYGDAANVLREHLCHRRAQVACSAKD